MRIRIPSKFKRDYGAKLNNRHIAYYDPKIYKPFERSLLSTATAQAKHLADSLIDINIVNNIENAATIKNIDLLKDDITDIASKIAYKEDKKPVIVEDGVVPDISENTELILSGEGEDGQGVD